VEEQEPQPTEAQAKPKFLFHYTGQSGLDGILKDHCIWATHYCFLNDSTERQLGLNIYKDAIFRIASEHFGAVEPAKTLVEYFQRSYTDALNAYIVSFCTSYTREEYEKKRKADDRRGGDRLSQWRGYAPGQQGYCLAFDFQLVRSIQQLPQNRNRCYHSFCTYSEGSIGQTVETHVREMFELQFNGFAVEDLKSSESLHKATTVRLKLEQNQLVGAS
jgi:hypothetical protein